MASKLGSLKAIIDSGRKAGIEAYHGSPYDFPAERELQFDDPKDVPIFDQDISIFDGRAYQPIDAPVPEGARVIQEFPLGRFDSNKIGTGEGAQAYGRGSYLAESEDVARGYRDSLASRRPSPTYKGRGYDQLDGPEYRALSAIEREVRYNKNLSPKEAKEAAITSLSQQKKRAAENIDPAIRGERLKDYDEDLSALRAMSPDDIVIGGRMYKVNIDADPDELIDWDELIDEQPKKVMDKLQSADWWPYAEEGIYDIAGARGENPTGADLVRWLEQDGQEYAAEALEDLGVKGIKYADAFTRHKPKDKRSNNYVIFDPRIIEISKKYGISIPLASAVIAGTMSPEEAQAASVGAVRKNIDEVLIQGQDADRGLGSLPGASGRTFKKQADETIARVYDNLRTQKDQYDEPVFDELPVGKLGGKTGRSRVTGVTRYRMPEGYAGSLEKLGRAAPDLIEIAPDADGAKYFSDQITSAKKANKFGASVYVYPQKEYKDMRLFITDDGSAGYALKPNGDVVSAFSSGTHKGIAQNILLHAVEQGGVKLDAFDTVLPDLYSTMGFRESGRIPWLDEEAPEDWNKAVFRAFNAGEPDVSFMAYSRDPAIPVEPRYESSYESAVEAQDRDVEDFRRSPLLNIINSGGAAGLGAAAMLSPEEAQAAGVKNIATEGIRSLGQTLEFDPRFDPRKREQEGLQSLRADFLPRNEQIIKPPLRLSDLEGEDFVTSMSDRTRAGGMIIGINDVPLYRAVDLRGGQDFMFENPNQVWASARVPSEKILEMAREFQGQSGKDPLFIPWRMAPTGGDFSNMVGELMLGFASSNMNKTTKKAFDAAVRKYRTKGSMDKGVRKNAGLKIKEWPGVDDPRAVEIWRSTPDAVRKELMNMMDVNFRKEGGLSIGAARLIASDPSQLMSRDAGLQNVGRIYTGRDIAPSTHPSYPYAVPGEGIGTLKGADEVTIFDLLPEARFGDAQKKVKDPANPTAQEMRALQMKPYGGTITENILRRIEERGVDVNSLTGLAPGALAFTLTSAGLLTPDEAAAGGLDEVAEVFGSAKGGLGSLPAATKKARAESVKQAKEQGYDLDNVMYHASKQDIKEFVPGYSDGLVFLTPNKEFANDWLGKGKFQERQGGTGSIEGVRAESERLGKEADKILKSLPEDQRQQYFEEVYWPQRRKLMMEEEVADSAIYPVVTRTKKPFVPSKNVDVLEELYGKEYLDAPFGSGFPTYRDALKDGNYLLYENKQVVDFLKSKGYDSMFLKENAGENNPFTTLAVFEPNNIRSVNAEFDPEKKDSPQILASAPFAAGAAGLGAAAVLSSEDAEAGGMGVRSRRMPDDVAFKAAPKKEPPGLPSLVGQLGLGAMSEIAGTIFGGAAGVDEYLRHGSTESIRDAREGTSEFVGGLYDAGPEAQQLGQEAVKGIAGIVGPTIDYAMEGPVMDERGLNVLPLIAKALNMSYEGWKEIYDLLPEREQEAVISAADAFL
jgi:hypothetical protein